MAVMIGCPSCGKTVAKDNAFCPHCGARVPVASTTPMTPTKKSLAGRALGLSVIALLVFFGIVLITAIIRSPTPGGASVSSGPTPAQMAEDRRLLETSMQQGHVRRYTCVGNEVFITPSFWARLNADAKRGFAISLARICDAEKSGDRITVINDVTGKPLATYSGGRYEVH